MSRLYGGFGELPLRESVLGAARQTKDRAIAELFEEVDELREALRLIAHRTPWDGQCCWCETAPFDDGSTKHWQHDVRCTELRELLDV
jgi:hypothetical protein